MGIQENNLRILVERSLSPLQRLWRVNAGQGWIGKILSRKNNILTLRDPRPFFGMPPGTTDMIGFDSIIITPEMVGKKVAVFVGDELKATKNDKLKKDQVNFKNLIVSMGGIHREHRETGEVIQSDNIF